MRTQNKIESLEIQLNNYKLTQEQELELYNTLKNTCNKLTDKVTIFGCTIPRKFIILKTGYSEQSIIWLTSRLCSNIYNLVTPLTKFGIDTSVIYSIFLEAVVEHLDNGTTLEELQDNLIQIFTETDARNYINGKTA